MKNSSRLLSIIDPIIRTWGSLSIGTRGQFKMGTRGSVCCGISTTIKEKVNEALKGATVTVQHTHSYCIERDLKEYADIRLWNRSIAFGLVSVVLVAIIVIIAIVHYNSEAYWGRQYYEVYSSPYLTDKEREKISRDVHTIAILPNEFDKDPKRVKEQIKKNRGILKERKKEAKKDKG
jgi:translation elongation factor EF-1beta